MGKKSINMSCFGSERSKIFSILLTLSLSHDTSTSVLFTNPPRILSTFVARVVNEPKTTYAEYPLATDYTSVQWTSSKDENLT